jgi:hypothetical protein
MDQESVNDPTEQWETGSPYWQPLKPARMGRYTNAAQMNSNFAPTMPHFGAQEPCGKCMIRSDMYI